MKNGPKKEMKVREGRTPAFTPQEHETNTLQRIQGKKASNKQERTLAGRKKNEGHSQYVPKHGHEDLS
jgi:hypothetical protein